MCFIGIERGDLVFSSFGRIEYDKKKCDKKNLVNREKRI